jgi:hypothetical protein
VSPYFFARYVDLAAANSAVTSAPQLTPELAGGDWQAFWQRRAGAAFRQPLPTLRSAHFNGDRSVAWGYCAMASALRRLDRWVDRCTDRIGNEMHGRYLVMVAPPPCRLVGRARLRAQMPVCTGGLLVAIFVFNLIYAQTRIIDDDARAMVQYYSETLDADDSRSMVIR